MRSALNIKFTLTKELHSEYEWDTVSPDESFLYPDTII